MLLIQQQVWRVISMRGKQHTRRATISLFSWCYNLRLNSALETLAGVSQQRRRYDIYLLTYAECPQKNLILSECLWLETRLTDVLVLAEPHILHDRFESKSEASLLDARVLTGTKASTLTPFRWLHHHALDSNWSTEMIVPFSPRSLRNSFNSLDECNFVVTLLTDP